MKITISRSLLSDALRKVQGVVSGKNSMPILSNVKIEASGDKITLTTTDLDMSVVLSTPCNVLEGGAITLPAKLLSDAIARSPEGDISLTADDATCKATIRAGSSTFKMAGLPAAEFPNLPHPEGDETEFILPQNVLKSMLHRTVFAMSQDDTRRTLKGVFAKFAEGGLSCVATDGRRMAIAEYHPDEAYQFDLQFTIPAKTVAELLKSVGNTGNITFKKCGSQITATFENGIALYSKLIEDAYPNYTQVIPKGNDNAVLVDREALSAAIERVGIFAESFAMKFEFASNEVKLTSSTETGKAEETVAVKYEGTPITVTFNHAYIQDVLKSMEDDEVKFSFADGTTPVVITCSQPGLSLVMPLRLT